MNLPPIVSPQEWKTAREELLIEEKELTHARDALAAKRRRMPRMAVEKDYAFEGRRQLIVYRFFFEPGVSGWPEGGCPGCSWVTDQITHPAHLNARDTTIALVSRAPQADIERWKARMGWEVIPWYTLTDDFDADFDVVEWHGTNVVFRDDDRRSGGGHRKGLRRDGCALPRRAPHLEALSARDRSTVISADKRPPLACPGQNATAREPGP